MSTFWESLKKNLQQGVQTVSEKTDELTKIGRLKIEVIAVKRDIEKLFVELGGRVYDILQNQKKASFSKDDEIKKLVERVEKFEKKLHELEERIQNIQDLKREENSNKTAD
jgi:prefoldin subunit 5